MATDKELQAKFSANQSGMESAFTALTKRFEDIEKASDRAASSIEKNMSRGMQRVFKTGEGFEKVGSIFTNISKKSEEVGNNLTKKITKPAMVAGGALASISIGKGFGRLVEIDNAEAKLSALGNSGKNVEEIMTNANKAVKGTSFGMGEAATTAANAVAAGIKPGKELTQYLTNTGDAAAVAGVGMDEMGRIFNKVQTSNKAYNGELQELSDRGLPIYQWLAKEANVAASEITDMAADGEISSKMLQSAIENNIGGAAKTMGEKSFTASLANMWAAVGRIGASFLDAGGKGGGFFSKMKPLMNDLTDVFDSMEGSAAKWGESLGIVFDKVINGIKGIVSWYNSLDKNTQKLIASIMKWSTLILIGIGPVLTIFGKLTGVIGTIFGPFGKFLKFFAKFSTAAKSSEGAIVGITKVFPKLGAALSLISGPVGWITLGVIALGTAFVVAYKKSETFRNVVNAALNGVKNAFITIGNIIKGFFQLFKGNGQDGVITLSKILPPNVVVGLTTFADTVKRVFFQVINAVKSFGLQIGQQLSAFWKQNGAEITQAVRTIGNIISTVFKFIWGNVIRPIMTLIWNLMKLLWPAIKAIVVSVWNNIKGVIQGALNIILGTIKIFSSLLTGNWRGAWNGLVQVLKGVVQLIWNLVQLWFVGKIVKVAKLGMSLLKGVFTKAWNFIKNFIGKTAQSIWNSVKQKFLGLNKSIQSITTSIKKWLSNTWTLIKNKVVAIAQTLWTNVRAKFSGLSKSTRLIFGNLSKYVRDLWTRMKNFITNLAQNIWTNVRNKFSGMYKSSREIFGRLFESAKNIFKNIKNRVTSLTHSARDNVVNGFKAMYDKGKSWIDKLKNFLKDSISGFKSIAKKVGNGVANGAIGGLNAMIDGINSLSDKIMKKKLIKKKIPTLSTGTGLSPQVTTDDNGLLKRGTKAIVNDKGPGNARGANGHKELIYRKGGKIERPIGNNKKVSLKRGDGVINGSQAKQLLPHFDKGTNVAEELWNGVKDTTSKGYHKVKDKGSEIIEGGKDLAGKAKKQFDKTIGDVMDYVKNPMKLIDKTMKLFGVDFSSIKGAMGGVMNFGYKGLKSSIKDLVSDWFAESEGGDGSSSWLPWKNILQTFGHYTGGLMFNGGRHYGIDFGMPTGTPIKALTAGKISQAGWVNGGGGNQVTLDEPNGKWFQWYMHMKDGGVKVKKGQKVQAGDLLGYSGSTGNSTTPHLHIQRMKGYPSNATAVDPMSWLKSLKGGGSKSASKWKPEVIKALKMNGLPTTSAYVNAWIRQIDTESSGNAGAMGGNDGLSDGNAMGLVQVKPGTFSAYKGKGMGNIWNPLHNLVAGMNYAKNTYGSRLLGTIGQGHGYAEGGIINSPEIAWLAEGGFSESVISHDPSMKARSKVIWDRTGEMLGFSEEAELLRGIYSAINEGNNLQSINNRDTNRIANKDTKVFLDSKEITKKVNNNQGNMARNAGYNLGMSGV
ncbi:peptidoglycan DD-metalloendopeptidase family protein [Mammaliicoccus sciuri]|uniref:peptidoglycan DD-metalloendopeptidase family protein n=1 Tax=Mammaliicoccus sciuri TaxID=1296 RepID=UPI0021CEB639|nr:peptidoglycan DD-metalloendopeptidase family protein [Mammaliicoccus sciuri]UXU79113.1 peptidoglycan DD-metalloendopeptidase family protein [Mammaliicoccus sciuri]